MISVTGCSNEGRGSLGLVPVVDFRDRGHGVTDTVQATSFGDPLENKNLGPLVKKLFQDHSRRPLNKAWVLLSMDLTPTKLILRRQDKGEAD